MQPSRIMFSFMSAFRAAALGSLFMLSASPVLADTVYVQAPVDTATINSNAVVNPEGSDQDVIAYDNFRLARKASISEIAWSGTAAGDATKGFTIKIYPSISNAGGEPDIANPIITVHAEGRAGETPVGNGLFNFHTVLQKAVPLSAHVQYWISISADKLDASTWGWADGKNGDGKGGDGRSVQSYSEFRTLLTKGDRAFSLHDAVTNKTAR